MHRAMFMCAQSRFILLEVKCKFDYIKIINAVDHHAPIYTLGASYESLAFAKKRTRPFEGQKPSTISKTRSAHRRPIISPQKSFANSRECSDVQDLGNNY